MGAVEITADPPDPRLLGKVGGLKPYHQSPTYRQIPMNEQRQQAYLELLQVLFKCESSTEFDNTLNARPELVDAGLLVMIRDFAQMLTERNDPDSTSTIQLLTNFANLLTQRLGLNLLMIVFRAIAENKGTPQVVYPLFQKNLPLLDEELIPLIKLLEAKFSEVHEDGRQFIAAEILVDFGTLIQEFPLGSRLINLEIAIACYQLALKVFTRTADPQTWAATYMMLANTYLVRIKGDRAANVEESISCYHLALGVSTYEAYPEQWGGIQMNLGNAYDTRIKGDRAANVEEAIACYHLVLNVFTHEAYPKDWAKTQMNLAVTYCNRIQGERAANSEKAIDCYRKALTVHTYEADPEQWAITQMNLAVTYRNRIQGERAANLEKAIDCYRKALTVHTYESDPEQWGRIQNNLGNVYRDRVQTAHVANLEEAIACYQLALRVRTREAFPDQWATTQMNLATAYSIQLRREGAANLEEASLEQIIAHFKLALEVRTREDFPIQWAEIQQNLAIFYAETGQDKLAIHHYHQAVEIFTPASLPQSALNANRGLGDIYFKQGDWQQAVDTYNRAIQAAETSRSWATDEDSRQRILREALSAYENTIQAHINLGQIDKAIATSERARSRQLVDFMAIQDLYPQGEVPEEVEAYIEIDRELQQYRQSDTPTDDRNLVTTNRSYTRDNRTAVIALETKKQAILQQIRERDTIAAGQIQVQPIELTTIQSLIKTPNTAILSIYTTKDDTHIFIITQNSEPQIYTIAGQGLATFQQWLQQQWLLPYALRNLTAGIDKLSPEQQQEFLTALQEYTQSNNLDEEWLKIGWRDRMTTTLAEIADKLQLQQLIDEKLTDITELVIIPHLYLHQIPFSAIPLGSGFLSDRFIIRYVPSCQILQYCTDRPAIEQIRYGTVEDADGTLPGAGYEGDRVAQLYNIPPEFRLRGKSQASIENYRQLLTQVNNLLSSHHASSQLDRPFESCLILADGTITLGDILTSRYPDLNEIFLSCCETHLGTTTITDDILTLATGFLCAGARSVISTLWGVDDLATSLFSIFYYQYRKEGLDRAIAIGKAQVQLRTLTAEKFQLKYSEDIITHLTAYAKQTKLDRKTLKQQLDRAEIDATTYQNHYDALTNVYQKTLKLLESIKQYSAIDEAHSIDYPFANPYFWAGFTCQGL
jgi:CHAT domain-containing protein